MNWDEKVLQKIEWNGEINNIEQKIKIAKRIASKVKQGDIIGVGSGSTSLVKS